MSRTFLLYIDPGTGSMLFTIALGLVTAGVFFLQNMRIRVKQLFRGGRAVTATADDRKMPYVIFTDSKRYWNVFRPVCDLFEQHKIPLVYYTCSEDDPALTNGYRFVKAEYLGDINRAATRLNTMNCGTCLSTTPGLEVYQWKRSKKTDRYVHICHSSWDISGYRMFGLDFYDAILLNGSIFTKQIRQIEQMRRIPEKDVRTVGLTYLDEMAKRLAAENGEENYDGNRPFTVLLAPSWGTSSILVKFGSRIIEALIATGYRIIIRPHPQSLTSDKKTIDRLREQYPDSEQLQWNFDNDNFEVLKSSDLMISDFSGVIFDYVLVFDRPLIYADTSFDRSPCDTAWLDENEPMWIFETLPRIGIRLEETMFNDMKKVIDEAMRAEGMKEGRERARNEAWEHRGESAQLVFQYLTGESDT